MIMVYTMTAALGGTWNNGYGKDYAYIAVGRGDDHHRGAIANTPNSESPWADEIGVNDTEIRDGQLHQYILTIDDSELAYYLDGVLLGTESLGNTSLDRLCNDFAYLGKGVYNVDGEWTGSIEEFRIYDQALTPGQILDLRPASIHQPSPSDGESCVPLDSTLSWTCSPCSTGYRIYLGTDATSVQMATTSDVEYQDEVSNCNFTPSALQPCQTYYWRIETLRANSMVLSGPVWQFTTWCDDCNAVPCMDPPEDLVAWWPFDEESGTLTDDLAGRVNNQGTLLNGAKLITSGMVARALALDGINDYVEARDQDELDFDRGDFSFDAWVNLADANDRNVCLLDKRQWNDGVDVGYAIFVYQGQLGLRMADVGYSQSNFVGGPVITDNQWHLIAITVDRDNPQGIRFYVDDSQPCFTDDPTGVTNSLSNSAPLWMGRNSDSNWPVYLEGTLDEVELLDRILSEDEIHQLWDAGSSGKCKDDIQHMKWSQPIVWDANEIVGWDEISDYEWSPIIADDWLCTDDRPITGIRWWGSFLDWMDPNLPDCLPTGFHIGIWSDTPNPNPNDPNSFSHPDRLIWEQYCRWSQITVNDAGLEQDVLMNGNQERCFVFETTFSEPNWFYQDPCTPPEGTVHWLSISALYQEPNACAHAWGWITRPHYYNDDAVRIYPPIASCPNDCSTYTPSSFGVWQICPSLRLRQAITLPLRNLYEVGCNKWFAHTFTGLPPCIKKAELTICMQAACPLYARNDVLALDYVVDVNQCFAWRIAILELLSLDDHQLNNWNSGNQACITLDLGALPDGTSILHELQDGELDVCIHDDTIISSVVLRVWSCPLTTGHWPPRLWDTYQNGEPIEFPAGISWDTAFELHSSGCETPTPAYAISPEDGQCCVPLDNGEVLLEWMPGQHVEEQEIRVWDSEGTLIWLESLSPGISTTRGPQIVPCIPYSWQVIEYGCNRSVASDIWTFTPSDNGDNPSAHAPIPADGTSDLCLPTSLQWSPGCCATEQWLCFSDNQSDVEESTLSCPTALIASFGSTVTQFEIDPSPQTTYYWKIITISACGAIESEVWSFTTADTNCCKVIDNFESYDANDNRVFNTWIDGYNIDENGSVAGHSEPPFIELDTVIEGLQSLPLYYDNTTTAECSEIVRFLESPKSNWTLINGSNPCLVIRHTGIPTPQDQFYIIINDVKVIWNPPTLPQTWYCWCIPLDSLGIDLTHVYSLCLGIESVNRPAPGGTGIIYIDDIKVCPECPCCILTIPSECITATASCSSRVGGPERTIDASGLNSLDQHSTDINDMWQCNDYDASTDIWIQYDFCQTYQLHEMRIWNHNSRYETFLGFGVKDVKIECQITPGIWTEIPGSPLIFSPAPGSSDYQSNTTVNLEGITTQAIRITPLSAWGMLNDQIGLSEVRFYYDRCPQY